MKALCGGREGFQEIKEEGRENACLDRMLRAGVGLGGVERLGFNWIVKDRKLLGASTAGMLDDFEDGIWEQRARIIYEARC